MNNILMLRELARADEGRPDGLLDEVAERLRIDRALNPERVIRERREMDERLAAMHTALVGRRARRAAGTSTAADELLHLLTAPRCQHCGYVSKDPRAGTRGPKTLGSCRWCFERLGGH